MVIVGILVFADSWIKESRTWTGAILRRWNVGTMLGTQFLFLVVVVIEFEFVGRIIGGRGCERAGEFVALGWFLLRFFEWLDSFWRATVIGRVQRMDAVREFLLVLIDGRLGSLGMIQIDRVFEKILIF